LSVTFFLILNRYGQARLFFVLNRYGLTRLFAKVKYRTFRSFCQEPQFKSHNSRAAIQPFRRAVPTFQKPTQTSSSSKNAGPFCELKKLKLFDLTVKDLQCFSHEDECFAVGNEFQ
jgi:hypothetical protein